MGKPTEKKTKKITKKAENSTIKPLPGEGGQWEKDRKIAKKHRKITL